MTAGRRSVGLRLRELRNRLIANPRFRRASARTPFVKRVANRRARELFDLTAGFTYTQTLLAFVQSGIGEALANEAATFEQIATRCKPISHRTIEAILRGAAGIDLVRQYSDYYALSDLGVALASEPGVLAMVRHHADVYQDLAEPLRALANDTPTRTAAIWQYAGGRGADGTDREGAERYSALMTATQAFVANEIVSAYRFSKHEHLVDVGGGAGEFALHVAREAPSIRATVFDLPDVVHVTSERMVNLAMSERIKALGGSFYDDPVPPDGDIYTLVRVLYDQDDEPARNLLANLYGGMPTGATILVAEPMASVSGAERLGTYFTMYLAAMQSGRCRTPREVCDLLTDAGFRNARPKPVNNPIFASLVMAER